MPVDYLKKNSYKFILIALIVFLGLILFRGMRPYLSGFLGAFTLYVILRGQIKFLVEKKKWPRALSATLILLEAMLLFLLPLTGFGILVVNTLSGINIDVDTIKTAVSGFLTGMQERFGVDVMNLDFLSFLPKVGTSVVQVLASNSYSLVINLFVIIFVLYFMLYSYNDFEVLIREMLPFTEQNKGTFIHESKSIIQANAIGIPLLALVQGFSPTSDICILAWKAGAVRRTDGFATILPLVGTGIVYVPLALVFIRCEIWSRHRLGPVWCIGHRDRRQCCPLYTSKLANIHPLITVFGVLMGTRCLDFGSNLRPLLLSLFMLFVNMYRHDYVAGSHARLHISSDVKKVEYKRIKNIKLPPFKKRKRAAESEKDTNEKHA